MSALMRDWIRPAVCKQLHEVLQDIAPDGKTSNSYGEDGTLMVHITHGRSIQVNEVSWFSQSRGRADPQTVHQSFSSIPSIGVRFLYSNQGGVHQIRHIHISEEALAAVLEMHCWSCTWYHGLLSSTWIKSWKDLSDPTNVHFGHSTWSLRHLRELCSE